MARGERGFTLIELMVVVTIIGILASVAMPIFRGYVQEAQINEAKPYLLEIAAKQRSYKRPQVKRKQRGQVCHQQRHQRPRQQLHHLQQRGIPLLQHPQRRQHRQLLQQRFRRLLLQFEGVLVVHSSARQRRLEPTEVMLRTMDYGL